MKRAKQMRAERDRQYGHIYAGAATDERWVGGLGEMVFNSWFKHEGIQGFERELADAADAPDFVTALNTQIRVKTGDDRATVRLRGARFGKSGVCRVAR